MLSSPACHLCSDALEALEELGRDYPLVVRIVDMASPEGKMLVSRFRPPMPPAVVIDGRLFSAGRLPRKKLRRLLERAA